MEVGNVNEVSLTTEVWQSYHPEELRSATAEKVPRLRNPNERFFARASLRMTNIQNMPFNMTFN